MQEGNAVALPRLDDVNAVLNYGADAQARVAEFSEIALQELNGTDPDQIGEKMRELIVRLREEDPGEKSGFMRLFHKYSTTGEGLKSRYRRALGAVDKIALSLQGHRDLLMKDIEMLEQLYAMNREQYGRLSEYVTKGRAHLEIFRETVLLPLRKQAEGSEDPVIAQSLRDGEEQALRFEKKLHDLELTGAVSLQMAPQIRILQNNNTMMAEKIQSSLRNAIPLWKSQMVLTLGTENTRAALKMQEQVAGITDELLKRNAELLRDTTVAVARQAEGGCISLETLRETNRILIETFDEVLKLREEGRQARRDARQELGRLDQQIRLRLIGSPSTPPLPGTPEQAQKTPPLG